jgi:hypothetical protein
VSSLAAERALARAGVGTLHGLRPNRWWSGACVLGGKITIATLSLDADGAGSFDSEKSGQFELSGRDQQSVQALHAEVSAFVERMSLTDMQLRLGPPAGPQVPTAESYICEAVMYHVASIRIRTIMANTLSAWMRHKGFETGSQARDKYWQFAFGAAAYATERDGVEVKLSEQE